MAHAVVENRPSQELSARSNREASVGLNVHELMFSLNLSINIRVVFAEAVLINQALFGATMVMLYVIICSTSSTPVEIMPTKPIATTSQVCDEHICCLSSQSFQGLL
jgi:hypothetical protein